MLAAFGLKPSLSEKHVHASTADPNVLAEFGGGEEQNLLLALNVRCAEKLHDVGSGQLGDGLVCADGSSVLV